MLLQIVACLAVALWSLPARAQFTDIGTLPGCLRSTATAINDNGQVVGYSTDVTGYTTHAFLYSNGLMTDLGTLGGTFSAAAGINSIGQVVGSASLANGMTHAFLYFNGVMSDLGTLPGGNSSAASAINSNGDIVGWANKVGGPPHAILYSKGAMTDLGTLPGYIQSFATAINSSGEIVGYVMGSWHNFHAFLYSNGVYTDLGALYAGNSWALGINDGGQVTGYISPQTGLEHAFLYSDGILTDVGALAYNGYDVWLNSRGYGINSSGAIAGTGDPGVFLYADGQSISGPLEGNFTIQAYAINDAGQVVGTTADQTQGPAFSQGHAFIWQTGDRPVITGLSPNELVLGSGDVTLTVTGKNFTPGATVMWDNSGRPTTYISATELTVQLSSSDIVASSFDKNYITVDTAAGVSGAVVVPIVGPAPRAKPGVPEVGRSKGSAEAQ